MLLQERDSNSNSPHQSEVGVGRSLLFFIGYKLYMFYWYHITWALFELGAWSLWFSGIRYQVHSSAFLPLTTCWFFGVAKQFCSREKITGSKRSRNIQGRDFITALDLIDSTTSATWLIYCTRICFVIQAAADLFLCPPLAAMHRRMRSIHLNHL